MSDRADRVVSDRGLPRAGGRTGGPPPDDQRTVRSLIGLTFFTVVACTYAIYTHRKESSLQGRGTLPPANTPSLPRPGAVKVASSPTAQASSASVKTGVTTAPRATPKVEVPKTGTQEAASRAKAPDRISIEPPKFDRTEVERNARAAHAARVEAGRQARLDEARAAFRSRMNNNVEIPAQLPDASSILVISAQPATPRQVPAVDFEIKSFPLDLSEGMTPSPEKVLEAVQEQLKAKTPSSKIYSLQAADGKEMRFGVICAPQATLVLPGFSEGGITCDKTSRFMVGVKGARIVFDFSTHPLVTPLAETLEKMGAYYCGSVHLSKSAGILDRLSGIVMVSHSTGG